MKSKKEFIDWLRRSGNPDNLVLAALLEEGIIGMPGGTKTDDERGGGECH